jgi:hypothetical protein
VVDGKRGVGVGVGVGVGIGIGIGICICICICVDVAAPRVRYASTTAAQWLIFCLCLLSHTT